MTDLSVYDNDPTLYLFTSLTAGSSHIVTATSRIETILKANKIPFKGVDTATDELARKLYGRRASGKKLPLLVKEGYVLGDLEMIEEWNEYGELKEALGVTATSAPAKPTPAAAPPQAPKADAQKENVPAATPEQNLAIRQLGAEAAKAAAAKKPTPSNISTTNPLLSEKVNSPAANTPRNVEPSGILSPRSIPLPATPTLGSEAASGVKSPIEPLKSSLAQVSPRSSSGSEGRRSFHGADVEDATKEDIKRIESETAIAEVDSSEEEDSEDSRTKKGTKAAALAPKTTPAPAAVTTKEEADEEDVTQKQSAKTADKASDSVKD